jgi:hypothetical protein
MHLRSAILAMVIAPSLAAGVSPPAAAPAYRQQLHLVTERQTLTGVDNIVVVVEDVPRILSAVLDAKTIQTSVEQRMRQTGLKVIGLQEAGDSIVFLPHLFVQVNAVQTADGGYAYSLNVDFKRALPIPGRGDQGRLDVTNATTWSRGSLGVVGKAAVDSIKTDLEGEISEFISDYLAAKSIK